MTSSPSHNEVQQSEAFTAMVRRQAEKFGERHNRLMAQLSEPTLAACLRQRDSEARRGIPLGNWSFEEGIADAFAGATLIRRSLASLGGRNKRVDALQGAIEELARGNPTISKGELLKKLEGSTHQGVVTDIEDDVSLDGKAGLIHFMDRGRQKTAKISGVQHRLSRARKSITKENIRSPVANTSWSDCGS